MITEVPPKYLYEYWVLTTTDCNLCCNYCFEENKVRGSKPNYKLEDLVTMVQKNNPSMQFENESLKTGVVFTGGEPLLNQEFILEFIEKTKKNVSPEYILQTNGTLLDKINPLLLENLNFILISIDGEKEIHDRNRGGGTYDKILENVMRIKPRFSGEIMARITAAVENDFSIYKAVKALWGMFDNFHWQLETPIRYVTKEVLANYLGRYKNDMNKLADLWMQELQSKNPKRIIPFQAVITPAKHVGLRCGAGTSLVVVDLDGTCYGCDSMIGDPRAKIGSIQEGFDTSRFNYQLKMNCSEEPLRCWNETYNNKLGCMEPPLGCSIKEVREFYCSTVHILENAIQKKKEYINNLIENKKIKPENVFMSRIAVYTEQIP